MVGLSVSSSVTRAIQDARLLRSSLQEARSRVQHWNLGTQSIDTSSSTASGTRGVLVHGRALALRRQPRSHRRGNGANRLLSLPVRSRSAQDRPCPNQGARPNTKWSWRGQTAAEISGPRSRAFPSATSLPATARQPSLSPATFRASALAWVPFAWIQSCSQSTKLQRQMTSAAVSSDIVFVGNPPPGKGEGRARAGDAGFHVRGWGASDWFKRSANQRGSNPTIRRPPVRKALVRALRCSKSV